MKKKKQETFIDRITFEKNSLKNEILILNDKIYLIEKTNKENL